MIMMMMMMIQFSSFQAVFSLVLPQPLAIQMHQTPVQMILAYHKLYI